MKSAEPFVFRWEPGIGPNAEALARLKSHWSEPRLPMGEAWFMGERRIYHELKGADPAQLEIEEIEKILWEIGSGTCAFGCLEEWHQWFHYLLPYLIPRFFETYISSSLAESALTALFALHPTGIATAHDVSHSGIELLRRDLLDTVGRTLMDSAQWNGPEPAESLIDHFGLRSDGEIWNCNLGGGAFGAVTLFCWKYLKPEEIDTWVESIFEIRSSYCLAQWLAWLVGAYRLITGSVATFTDLDRLGSQLQWENSHVLKRHFQSGEAQPIPLVDEPNRAAFALALRRRLTESVVLEWIEGFSRFDHLEESLGWLPDQFIAQYFSRTLGDPFYTPT